MKTTDNQNELFVVVDENDNIIGYKTRYECHHDKTLIHRSTGVIIFNNEGKVLFQKRSRTKDLYPGYYTLSSSGHVMKGEEYIQAANRELKEEIGIKNVVLTFIKKIKTNLDKETEFTSLFMGNSDGPFTFNKNETQSIALYSQAEIHTIKKQLTPLAVQGLQIIGWL